MSRQKGILFAGGGTGGHIFPGMAIAECIREARPDWPIQFLCSTRPGDASMLGAEQLGSKPVEFTCLPAQPFLLKPRGLLRFIGSWGGAVRSARAAIRSMRECAGTVTVVAMGGFVAAPAAQAARAERCPIFMVNLDAVPGRANAWIARHATHVFTTAEIGPASWRRVSPIVRRAARAPGTPEHCKRLLGLDPSRPALLVTGASLGAQTINKLMIALLEKYAPILRNGAWQVVHQSGKSDIEELRVSYRNARVDAVVEPFFREMGVAWGCAEAAISRAGAGSVAEAWYNRVPTLFLPYPFHADQHQKHNAKPLIAAGAAMVVEDRIEARDNVASVGPVIAALLTDSQQRAVMRAAMGTLGHADGAERVAKALLTDT